MLSQTVSFRSRSGTWFWSDSGQFTKIKRMINDGKLALIWVMMKHNPVQPQSGLQKFDLMNVDKYMLSYPCFPHPDLQLLLISSSRSRNHSEWKGSGRPQAGHCCGTSVPTRCCACKGQGGSLLILSHWIITGEGDWERWIWTQVINRGNRKLKIRGSLNCKSLANVVKLIDFLCY